MEFLKRDLPRDIADTGIAVAETKGEQIRLMDCIALRHTQHPVRCHPRRSIFEPRRLFPAPANLPARGQHHGTIWLGVAGKFASLPSSWPRVANMSCDGKHYAN